MLIDELALLYLTTLYLAGLFFAVRNKDLLNPFHVFSFIMLIPCIMLYVLGHSLHEKTYLLYILTVTSFAIRYLYVELLPKLLHTHVRVRTIKVKSIDRFRSIVKALLNLYLIIGLVGFVLAALKAYHFSQLGPDGAFFNLRYANTVLGMDLGIPKYMFFSYTYQFY